MTLRTEFDASKREPLRVTNSRTRFWGVTRDRDIELGVAFQYTCRDEVLSADFTVEPIPPFCDRHAELLGCCWSVAGGGARYEVSTLRKVL